MVCHYLNTGEVASCLDDVIVGTKKEEEYNKIVEEVMKRLAENDLYVKLEKCKWKKRKVVSRPLTVDFILFSLFTLFYFSFSFLIFYF